MSEQQTDETPLALATVAQLVQELERRHSAILVVTDGEIGLASGQDVTNVWHSGSRVHALGLAEWSKQFLAADAIGAGLDACTGGEGT